MMYSLGFAALSIFWAVAEANTAGSPWKKVTSDSTGQYLAAVMSSGYNSSKIQISNDYGSTWQILPNSPVFPWWDIRSDLSGKHLIAAGNCQSSNYIGCPSPYYSSDRGNTWTEAEGTGDVLCYSVAQDGKGYKMTAVCLYADASKGQMMGMFQSYGGYEWDLVQAPYTEWYNAYGHLLAMAMNTGDIVYEIEQNIWVWGSGKYNHESTPAAWTDVATDYNAVTVAAVSNSQGKGSLSVSTDSGKTYTTVSTNGFTAVAVDGSGVNVYAAGADGYIYVYKAGKLTKTSAPKATWNSIATDSTGTNIVASAGTGGLYVSRNAGSTWTLC